MLNLFVLLFKLTVFLMVFAHKKTRKVFYAFRVLYKLIIMPQEFQILAETFRLKRITKTNINPLSKSSTMLPRSSQKIIIAHSRVDDISQVLYIISLRLRFIISLFCIFCFPNT